MKELLEEGYQDSRAKRSGDVIEIWKFAAAQDYLVRVSYEDDNNLTLQKAFNSILPRNSILQEKLDWLADNLRSSNLEKRIATAKQLRRSASLAFSGDVAIWLRHPDLVKLLLSSLAIEKDNTVVVLLLNSLGAIHGRYFSGASIGQAIVPFIDADNELVKAAATFSIARIDVKEKWAKIIKLSRNLTSKKIWQAILLNIPKDPKTILPKHRIELMASLFEHSNKKTVSKDLREEIVAGICWLANTSNPKTKAVFLEMCNQAKFKKLAMSISQFDGIHIVSEFFNERKS
ncbi:MAG: hypothetical protein R3C03_23840 [Pirellulaceae bacterium]